MNNQHIIPTKEEQILLSNFMDKPMPMLVTWCELMEVVEKITCIPHDSIEILKQQTKVLGLKIFSPLQQVYSAVIAFITWYNQNK